MSEAAAVEAPVAETPTPEAPVVETPTPEAAAPEVAAPTPEPESAPVEAPVDDWRTRMSGGNEKTLERLGRYGSEEAVADALMAAQQKISSGEMLPKLDDKSTPEEIAAYRKDMGIPETHNEYEFNLPEGFVFGEEDKPFLDNALKVMHDANSTPAQINAMLNAHAANIENQALAQQDRDNQQREQTEDRLRAEYGTEYRANLNIVTNFISTAPEEVQQMLMNGRGPDGTAFMNNPEMVRWINDKAREINPAASVMSVGGNQGVVALQDEIAELKAEMDADIGKWHKSPEKKARYQELLQAEEKVNAKK